MMTTMMKMMMLMLMFMAKMTRTKESDYPVQMRSGQTRVFASVPESCVYRRALVAMSVANVLGKDASTALDMAGVVGKVVKV